MGQKRREEKEEKFREEKRRFWVWEKMRRDSQGKNNLYTKYDICFPQIVADQMQNIRLAMVMALPLNKLPLMTWGERVSAWVTNLVYYFQDGICWENFVWWLNNEPPSRMVGPGGDPWENVAGRMFFNDLLDSIWWVHRGEETEVTKVYQAGICEILGACWKRLVNQTFRQDMRGRKEECLNDIYGQTYELEEYYPLCEPPIKPDLST
jgi:hypothetical protein